MRKDFIKSPLSAVLPDFVLFLLSSLQTYLPLPGSVALTDEIWQHFLKKQTKKNQLIIQKSQISKAILNYFGFSHALGFLVEEGKCD